MKFTTIAIVLAALAGTNMPASGSDAVEQKAPVCMDVITGSPAECPAQPVAAVDVQIHDYTNLDPNSLGPFLSSIRNILASTGMSVKVSLCRGNGALPHCLSGISETLVVRILDGYAKTTKNARGETLGESYSTAAGGTLASIYLGSVHQQAHAANVPWLTALSFVAAHEVGHLLLGTRAHTSRGLMKAVWDRNDFVAIGQNHLHFAPEQALALATRYAVPVAASNAK